MLRWLIKLALWLDRRFPEKLVVKLSDYVELKAQLEALLPLLPQVETLVSRVSVLETSAVHKGAVQDLVGVVAQVKDEVASLKTSLGFNRIGDASIRAILNGEPITTEETSNEQQ